MIAEGTLTAVWDLGGILLGGGLQARREWLSRRAEARAIEAALVAEIGALLATIEARGLIDFFGRQRARAEHLVRSGQDDTPILFPRVAATWNYFATYDAVLPKIGLLPVRKARALTHFYVSARSSSEMLLKRPGSSESPLPAKQMLLHLLTEEHLFLNVVASGKAILDGRWNCGD